VTDSSDKDTQPETVIAPDPDPNPEPESGPAPVPAPEPEPVEARAGDDAGSSQPRGKSLRWLIIALLCLMLLTLLGVVVVLPDLVAERVIHEQKPVPESPPVTAPAPPPSADAQRLAREKRKAENRLGIVLRKQTELEAEGVATWGEQDYDVALNALAAGDVELQVGRYGKAADIYDNVSEQLDRLRESMAERMESALQAGDAALAANDGPAARFSSSVSIWPSPSSPAMPVASGACCAPG